MNYQLIITVINSGYSDEVMAHAKKAGAYGGTVLHARGTGDSEIAKLFNITIQPEKELILIISPEKDKEAIMKAIAKGAGLTTDSHGIVFSLPIADTIGLFVPNKGDEEFKPEVLPVGTTAATGGEIAIDVQTEEDAK